MKFRLLLSSIAVATVLVGCATGYHDVDNPLFAWSGGYWDQPGPGKLFKVGFNGNGLIKKEKVGTYLLYRCAEVAKREGRSHFALYETLPDAIRDLRSSERTVTTIGGKPTIYAYILIVDPGPGALSVDEVLRRLKPEVDPEDKG